MAALAQPMLNSNGWGQWLWQWLKVELAPYPGRYVLVARMVGASTLVMVLSMTFRLPYGAYAAVYALVLSRESLVETASAVRMMTIGYALAGGYAIVGAMLVAGDPMLRFFWVAASLFLIFFLLSATKNYGVAARFGYLVAITIPLWDRQIPAEARVEGTLWAVGALTMAIAIGLLLEAGLAAIRKENDLMDPVTERLACVEELLRAYANDRPVSATNQAALERFSMLGTSRLRRILHRSGYGPQYAQQMGAVVALAGRLVDIAANFARLATPVSEEARSRIDSLAGRIATIRDNLKNSVIPLRDPLCESPAPGPEMLDELEKTVSLIPEAFVDSTSTTLFAPSSREDLPPVLFSDILTNAEHIKFGLRGALAATACYVIYNALFWSEVSTAVTTCLLTALTTVGASRQKQVLRFAGALVGGLGVGLTVQVFILPYIDSIVGFTVLFVVVASGAAWIATASPRLSYLGVQVAVAFCLINLQEFTIQTSLTVGRDRVIGILLGLFMMWLFFDQLWSVPAGVEMRRAFVSNLRLLAQGAREPVSADARTAMERSYRLRETIQVHLDKVRSLGDGVLFEFGPSRQRDLALRALIRTWQPQLRALFIMRIALWKHRVGLPGFELPETIRSRQRAYDESSAQLLEELADRFDRNGPCGEINLMDHSQMLLQLTLQQIQTEGSGRDSYAALLRNTNKVMTSLATEIVSSRAESPSPDGATP